MGCDPALCGRKVFLHLLYVHRRHGLAVGPLYVPQHLFILLHRVMVALQGRSSVLIGDSGIQVASALSQYAAYVGIRRRRRFRTALNSIRHTVRKGRRIAGITRLPLLNVLQQAAVCRVLPANIVHR